MYGDSVVGKPLVNNVETAFPKLDPDQQQSSTIYGMSLGINWDPNVPLNKQKNGFYGDFVPSTVTRDISGCTKSNKMRRFNKTLLDTVYPDSRMSHGLTWNLRL